MIRFFALVLLCFLTACTHPPQSPTLDSIAHAYVRVVLALGERDPDSLDFAAVAPSLCDEVHQSYPTYDTIDRETSRLLAALGPYKQQPRAQFLILQLQAIQARILTLKGHPQDFLTEARILFNTQPLPDTGEAERAATRKQILSLLPPAPGTPAARYAAYDRRFLIPPDRLPQVFQAALAACRTQTLAHIPLPPNERIDVTFVTNQPWSAFSRFHGDAHSTISLNTRFPITVDQALELACHEGYPGHHTFNILRDLALAQNQHLPEAQVQPTFSPQSYFSESAAAFAPRLAFTPDERLRVERDILFPLAGLPPQAAAQYVTISSLIRQLDTAQPAIAQQYLDGQFEFVRAARALEDQTLMAHPEATLLYLNEYRAYMLAYTDGPRRIAALIGSGPAVEQWSRYLRLAQ